MIALANLLALARKWFWLSWLVSAPKFIYMAILDRVL